MCLMSWEPRSAPGGNVLVPRGQRLALSINVGLLSTAPLYMAPRASLLPALWIVWGCARFGRTAPVLDQVAMEIDGVHRTGRRWREVLLQLHHANQAACRIRSGADRHGSTRGSGGGPARLLEAEQEPGGWATPDAEATDRVVRPTADGREVKPIAWSPRRGSCLSTLH